jgi:RND family efflux transporter MFP subunit
VHSVDNPEDEAAVTHHSLPLVAVVLLGAGCSAPPERTAQASPPAAVSIVVVRSAALASSFEAGGVVRARTTATIASRMMAPIVDVHVRAGDHVRRGARLVTLDGREPATALSRARATSASAREAVHAAESDVGSSQAAVTLARATHDRIRTLHDKRSATPQELDQAVATLAAAEAQLSGAEARLAAATAARDAAQSAHDAAQIAASYTELVAPFDGLIIERSVDPGTMATPGMPLLTLEDSTTFRLEVALDETRATQVAVGQDVEVQIGDPGRSTDSTVSARVTEIGRLDPTAHSFLVKLDLPPRPSWRSGLFGRARFAVSPRQALVVPSSCAVRRGQLTFVYTVDADGRARLQPVSPGAEADDRIEILAGIREGNRVIADPPAELSDGARVTEGHR